MVCDSKVCFVTNREKDSMERNFVIWGKYNHRFSLLVDKKGCIQKFEWGCGGEAENNVQVGKGNGSILPEKIFLILKVSKKEHFLQFQNT